MKGILSFTDSKDGSAIIANTEAGIGVVSSTLTAAHIIEIQSINHIMSEWLYKVCVPHKDVRKDI